MSLIQNVFDDVFDNQLPLDMRNMGGNLQGRRNVDVYGNPLGQMGMNEGMQHFDQANFFTFYFLHFVLFDNALSSLFNLDYSDKDSSSYGRR
jgi:hypothetical protein